MEEMRAGFAMPDTLSAYFRNIAKSIIIYSISTYLIKQTIMVKSFVIDPAWMETTQIARFTAEI